MISYDLDNYSDISLRIEANQAIGSLKISWDLNHVEISAKFR